MIRSRWMRLGVGAAMTVIMTNGMDRQRGHVFALLAFVTYGTVFALGAWPATGLWRLTRRHPAADVAIGGAFLALLLFFCLLLIPPLAWWAAALIAMSLGAVLVPVLKRLAMARSARRAA
ncbi:hypothetical protein [Dactylosporangium sp. CA-139066]|uniref:hypothetical protein n=1 Tax=Dactylosporangium sp. CA-139066 TaxID=3239930 RepID=UPI003D8AFD30